MSGRGRRLLVVEDEPLMGSLLAEVLVAHDFRVRNAESVPQARAAIREFDPDAILLDISLGDGPSGLDLAQALSVQRPDIAIIFLTKHPDTLTAGREVDALPEGCGFLRKDKVRDSEYLLRSIDAVLTDEPLRARHDLDHAQPLSALDARHIETLRLIAMGYTNEHIAAIKGVAQSTVERWTVELFRELGIDTKGIINPRVEAVRRFITAAGVPDRP